MANSYTKKTTTAMFGLLYLAAGQSANAQLPPNQADAAIKCHQYFGHFLNQYKASYHKVDVKLANDVYRLHWQPQHFKAKNGYGQWIKSHAFCELGYSMKRQRHDVLLLLKIGDVTIVNQY